MSADLAERMRVLVTGRVPFVHATVVRAQIPTSVVPGDDAIVLADGSIEGFVGGVCAETSVRAAALGALANGRTVLLRVLPDGADHFPESPGAQVVVNPCLSGGAMEIFLQPLIPPPVMWVVGESPIADALAELGAPLGFVVRRTTDDAGPDGATAVVVSSHGRDEEPTIRGALDAGAGYVGLIASRRRGDAVLSGMRLTPAERARVHSPAGLDIGARTAHEIALSVLAEIVAEIRTGAPAGEPPGAAAGQVDVEAGPVTAVDPVCGMTVVVGPDAPHLVVQGDDVWFCGTGCRTRYAESHGR